jgi:hypothetical protein
MSVERAEDERIILTPCHPERSKNAHERGRFAESKDPFQLEIVTGPQRSSLLSAA